ncbi:MAG: phenylalanine 4-monooxygenase [Gammaproteobacteria bacterium]
MDGIPTYDVIPDVPASVYVAPLKRPAGLSEDWLEPAQRRYSADEHRIWDALYERQMKLMPGRACREFMFGLDRLNLHRGGVPDFNEISEELRGLTGWSVVPVPMLIPDHVFYYHLANRRFPAGNFIRTREQFDYIQEPDVFHDVFGHVPLLTDPVFANYMEAYGRAGWKALKYNRLKALSALYWYTVEFGLTLEEGAMRIYGAGILSGPTETVYALDSPSPNRIHLNVDRVMRTDYTISDLQTTYFVIESFRELFHMTEQRGFEPIYESLAPAFQYAKTAALDTDHIYHRGTQEYELRGGRGSGASPLYQAIP